MCSACDVFITTAVKNASLAFNSDIGQQLLRSAEAFANRDYQNQPIDSLGRWHQGVATQRTSRWEPWNGNAAQTAHDAVCQHVGQPLKQAKQLFHNYRDTPPEDVTIDSSAAQLAVDKRKRLRLAHPRKRRIATEHNFAPMNVLKRLHKEHNTTTVRRPFCLLLNMKLLPADWGYAAEHLLRQYWTTAWGGGNIINTLLFDGEHIVPETQMDMRRQSHNQCF